jgi:hypothetical protein
MAPQDHGFVAGGQVLVVAGGAPAAELVADAYRVSAPKRLVAWLDVDESGTPGLRAGRDRLGHRLADRADLVG